MKIKPTALISLLIHTYIPLNTLVAKNAHPKEAHGLRVQGLDDQVSPGACGYMTDSSFR